MLGKILDWLRRMITSSNKTRHREDCVGDTKILDARDASDDEAFDAAGTKVLANLDREFADKEQRIVRVSTRAALAALCSCSEYFPEDDDHEVTPEEYGEILFGIIQAAVNAGLRADGANKIGFQPPVFFP